MERLDLRGVDGAEAQLSLHGAHVLGWVPEPGGPDRLYLSGRSAFGPDASIRGGIPVIFPQFATEGPLPRHGFARSRGWTLVEQQASRAVLRLVDDAATRTIWPHGFVAELEVSLMPRALRVGLQIHNRGADALQFTAALHTYFRVDDIAAVGIEGLQGLRYRDSVRAREEAVQHTPLLHIEGEVDRVYFDTPHALQLRDGHRGLRIEQAGFADTVIWNPGAARAAELKDLDEGGWRHFVCIEAACIGRPVQLASGASWAGAQILHAG